MLCTPGVAALVPRRLPVHERRESTIAELAPLSCPSVNHADCDGDSLVSIPDRDLGHARDLGDFLLRTRLVAENRGNVDRGRGHPTRRYAGREFVLLDLVEDFLRLSLDVHVQLEAVAEPGDVVPRTLRQKLEPQFADKGPIRPSDRLAVHARLRGDFVQGPRYAGLPARGIEGRGDDLIDRPTADEILRRGPSVQDRGILADVAGQTHLRSHRVDLREALGQRTLPALRRPDAVLPLP